MSATGAFGGFLHLCNELTVSSFGLEGYFVSNYYSASVVSQTNCIVARADFNEIRKNQQALLKAQEIQNKEDISLGDEERKFANIKVKTTNSKIDLDKPLDNAYVNNMKDIANVRISFLKSIYGNKYFAILGALGQPGNTVKILDEKGSNLGIFKVMDSISGETLKKIKRVKGNKIFDVYLFDKKI